MLPNGAIAEVRNSTRDTIVARHAIVARSFLTRGRGLMFQSSLDSDSGLIIDPCSSIHMFFMRFPIDVLYVSGDDVVVRTQRAIRPWRVGPLYTRGAKYVVELPVGSIDRSGTVVGDQLTLATSRQRQP